MPLQHLKSYLLISALGLATALPARAQIIPEDIQAQIQAEPQTLILKDGRRIEGHIVEDVDDYIAIDVSGVTITYYKDQIDSIEKTIPAIIVKDEAQKQEVIQRIVDEQAADVIYDIKAEEKPSPTTQAAQESLRRQQTRSQAIDAPGKPLGNVGIQFGAIKDDPAFHQKDPSEETPEERSRREAAERFYNER